MESRLIGAAMSTALASMRILTDQVRGHLPALVESASDPHAELMAMVWGSRFDREHALNLWAQLPQPTALAVQPLLAALYSAADRFDAMAAPGQQHLRRLILRHRTLSRAGS